MDIDEARRILADNPFEHKKHELINALHAFQRYNDDALETLAERDRVIEDLEGTLHTGRQVAATANKTAADRQAVIDAHGEAITYQRRMFLKESDGVKRERDQLRTSNRELERERDEARARICELEQRAGTAITNAVDAAALRNVKAQLGALFDILPDHVWTVYQERIQQAVNDQKRWRQVRDTVAEAGKLRDGDQAMHTAFNPLTGTYTMRFEGAMYTDNPFFRSPGSSPTPKE